MTASASAVIAPAVDTTVAGSVKPPPFIAIEGPIGVGKTTLTHRLAASFNYQTLLEEAEHNPFLERFYQNPVQHALPTQLHFLFDRVKKLQALRQGDIFEQVRIADFLIDKDPLFAQLTLASDELRLYQAVYEKVIDELPRPDLVVYLQASTDTLMERIGRRGLALERPIERSYLAELNDAYTQFFYYYDATPLLIVNAEQINLADGDADYHNLLEYLLSHTSGRHYYNPTPL
jgi:deoxyadenosine/deoxycytidine kinase